MAAEEIIFKVGVDTGNSVNDLNKVEKELGDIDKAASGIGTDVAARFDALNKKVASGTMNMREAQKAVKEYQTIALQAGRESPVGQEAIKRAGELKDTIGDLRTEITNAGTDGASMQAALQLGSSVAAGYGAMQGTMALLGGESEALQQTFVKLQAVQTVLASVEQIRAALEKESFLMMKARTVATKAQTAAEVIYTAAVGGTTGAMKALRLAMLAIPIVALVAGIVALVSAVASLVSQEEKAEKQNEAITKSYERMSRASEAAAAKRKANSDTALELARIEGKSIEEIHELERLNILDTEGERKNAIENEKFAISQRKLAYQQALDEGNEDLAKSIKDEINQHRDKYRNLTAQNNQYKNDLKILDAQLKKDQEEADKEEQKKREEAAKNQQRKREEEAKKRLELQRTIEDLIIANIEDADQRALAQLNLQQQREREELIKQYGNNATLIAELETRQQQEQLKLMEEQDKAYNEQLDKQAQDNAAKEKARQDKEFADQKAAAELKLMQAGEDFNAQQEARKEMARIEMEQALAATDLTENEKKLIVEKYNQEIQQINKDTADREKQLQKDVADAKVKIATDSLQLVSNITELFGKNNEKAAKRAFQIDKAAKLASATISGIEGTINAYKTAQGSPITGVFPAYPAIQAGLAAAFAATNIAKIAQTQFSSSSGGGSQASVPAPSQGVPSVPTPEVNANTTLTAGLPGAGTQAGNKVYVLDSEITAQQTMSQKVTSLATFGG